MRRVALAALVAAGLLASAPANSEAQQWRTLGVSRQLLDSSALRVKVRYGAGRLGVRAANTPVMYDMELRYDPRWATPVHTYSQAARTVELGVSRLGDSEVAGGDRNRGELRLALTGAAPLDLALELGAVQADLELGGLRLERLSVSSGASEGSIHFDAPNGIPMRSLDLDAGAASLRALRLANARASEVTANAGVGNMDLDFGGTWSQDVDLRVRIALGGVTVRVPHDVGVEVVLDKLLASFDHEGLTRRGDAWITENWDSAPYKLRIRTQTTFGTFELDRTGQ
jgi:hypothetical protein